MPPIMVPPIMVPGAMPEISSGTTFENLESRNAKKFFSGGTKDCHVIPLFALFEACSYIIF